MLERDPTYLGTVAAVSGASLHIHLAPSVASNLSLIKGRTYRVAQVGSFIRIPQGYQDLLAIVTQVGAGAIPESVDASDDTGRWMKVELVGELLGGRFDRGIIQYPNVADAVHLAIEEDLRKIYDIEDAGHVTIGSLSGVETIPARISINELVTRHSTVLGSTGSGKSTTVASLIRALLTSEGSSVRYPSARVLLLDVHGEYALPLADVAQVFSVEPREGERPLFVPYWAIDTNELLNFLTGGVEDRSEAAFADKLVALKTQVHEMKQFAGVDSASITVDTPLPFSLKQLWYDLLDWETRTFSDSARTQPAISQPGDAATMTPPVYQPHGMGSAGPFLNSRALGIRRQLDLLRSRLLDRRYDFLLHPGPWEPTCDGVPQADLDELLAGWLGGEHPLTVLDLSSVPSGVLERLVGSILNIVYESLYWSREWPEGGVQRPLLIVLEEAHRYLSQGRADTSAKVVRRIVKEGRKYGVGAMIVSQRPGEIDETILSQCGTFVALRLANPGDRARVRGTLPDGLAGLLDVLPILRTGEAVVTGQAAKLPMRCRVTLPPKEHRPRSEDPEVSMRWARSRGDERYARVVAAWRGQRSDIASDS